MGALLGTGVFAAFMGAGYLYVVSPTIRSVVQAVRHNDITPDRAFPGKNAVNLLIIGADQDRDDYKRVVGTAQRSDALMVARLDFANQRAAVVSIPRDTKIHIPGYRGYQKINAAFAYGGSDLSKKVVEGLLGTPIDNVVALNFDGFKRLVDLMGGVPITVDKPLNYDDNWGDLHVHLSPGAHWMNGEQALGFVRIRHVDSDMYRTGRQQQFLQAVKGRMSDPRVWWKVPQIVEAARTSIVSDLQDNQLLSIMSFVKGLPKGALQTQTLPGDEGPSFVVLYPSKVRELARTLLAVDDAPLEGLGGRYDRTRMAREDEPEGRTDRRRSVRRRRASNGGRAVEDATWHSPSRSDEFNAPLSDQGTDAESAHGGDAAAPSSARVSSPPPSDSTSDSSSSSGGSAVRKAAPKETVDPKEPGSNSPAAHTPPRDRTVPAPPAKSPSPDDAPPS